MTMKRRAGALQGIVLLLPSTLMTMGIVVLVPILPQLMDHFGGVPNAAYWVPMVLTTPSICLVAFSPVAGFLADLFGRRRMLLCAMAVYGVVGMLPVVLDDLRAILLSRIGLGVVEAVVLTVSTTLISDFFKGAERDKWLASQSAVASISAAVLIFIGGLLGTLGWRGPFLIYGCALVLMVLVLMTTWEPEPDDGAAEPGEAGSWSSFPWSRMLGICAITFFAAILFYTVTVELPFALQLLGVSSPSLGGALQALASLGVPAGTFVFRFQRRRPPLQLLAMALLLLGLGFLAMSASSSVPVLVLSAGINQLGAGIVLPTLLTWAIRPLPFNLRGRGTGIWQGVFASGQFFMPIIVTFLSGLVGGLFGVFTMLGVAALVAALLGAAASLRLSSRAAEEPA